MTILDRSFPGASSDALSVPNVNRPTVPVTLVPAIGSTICRVWTAACMLASPFPAPELETSDPWMKNGRFSE